MKTDDSKLVLGLIIGAAVGAAIGGLLVYANYKEGSILDDLQQVAETAKKKVSRAIDEGLEELEDASERITKKAQKIIKKTDK